MAGCTDNKDKGPGGTGVKADSGPRIQLLSFDDPIEPTLLPTPVSLLSARNETVSFAVQVSGLPVNSDLSKITMRLQPMKFLPESSPEKPVEKPVEKPPESSLEKPITVPAVSDNPTPEKKEPEKAAAEKIAAPEPQSGTESLDLGDIHAYQMLPMPVDLNHAGFLRHTGREPSSDRRLPKSLPRALLPLKTVNGTISLDKLRDPAQPRDPKRNAIKTGAPTMIWIDLPVAVSTHAGEYRSNLELLDGRKVIGSIPVSVVVNDFALSDERHLLMVGRLDWNALRRVYPGIFETVRPEFMSRQDARFAAPMRILDQLVEMGQKHRTQVVIPQLQPLVKWQNGPRPQWEDFDAVVSRWITGEAFADRQPLGYWPLPETNFLASEDEQNRKLYWSAVASHFDQRDWLKYTTVDMEGPKLGTINSADSLRLCAEAARILSVHPRVRVRLPVDDEMVQFPVLDASLAGRLVPMSPGFVYSMPLGNWPKEIKHPPHWIRTDMPGLIPNAGFGGDQRDVRAWAWLAFMRQAELIQWNTVLPSHEEPDFNADPGDVPWFYPGEWFGHDEPVPTVHMKWMLRAEQDYEYLYLARQRGERLRAEVLARLITKPVEIPLLQIPDTTFGMLSGAADSNLWASAKSLLADMIILRPPGVTPDVDKSIDLNGRIIQWAEPQERPILLGRATTWGWSAVGGVGTKVDFRIGLDVYNAADRRLIGKLQWGTAPTAWIPTARPVIIPPNLSINTYNIRRFSLESTIDLDKVTADSRKPISLLFADDLTNRESLMRVVAPVAISDRRGPGKFEINGDLQDWSQADAIHDGPLVRMYNRPAIQRMEVEYASTPSQIYSAWSDSDIYFAFKVAGVQPITNERSRSWVEYQLRRAWEEDTCEVLAQPVYADSSEGPVLHVACKPRGQIFVQRKLDRRLNSTPWENAVMPAGQSIRYAANIEPQGESAIWRAELAIPWSVLNDPKHEGQRPTLIRFNFSQHKNATGESASWAGPVDFGREENFTGLLFARDPAAPGIKRRD